MGTGIEWTFELSDICICCVDSLRLLLVLFQIIPHSFWPSYRFLLVDCRLWLNCLRILTRFHIDTYLAFSQYVTWIVASLHDFIYLSLLISIHFFYSLVNLSWYLQFKDSNHWHILKFLFDSTRQLNKTWNKSPFFGPFLIFRIKICGPSSSKITSLF